MVEVEAEAKEAGEVAVPIAPTSTGAYDPNVEPPYGWVVCIAMHLINGFTWGIIASYGVYLSYYINHETFPGASDLDFAFVGGVNFATALLCAPIVNVSIRLFGTKFPMYCGCFLFAGGFIAASFATKFWHLILTQGILVGLGVGCCWLPATPLLPSWFNRNRSLAQGIAAAGSGVGGIIFSAATTPMIENLSLAWSLRIIGIVSFGVLFIATVLMRDRNATIKPRLKAFDIALLRRYRVWLLIGYSFFSISGYIICTYTLSAFALSLGLSQHQGGIVTTVLNVGTAIGRPGIGVLSDRFGRMTVASGLTAVNTLMVFAVWIPTTSFGLLLFLAFVLGITAGVYWGTIAPLCAEVVELKELPTTLGLMWLSVSMPALFSEAIALGIRQPHHHRPYLWPEIYTGITFLLASLFMLELKRQKWGLFVRERHRDICFRLSRPRNDIVERMPVTEILLLRHGHRLAWTLNPVTGEYTSNHPFPTGLPADPPLASHGVQQARETARHLGKVLEEVVKTDRVRIYSSLFYRCLETLRPTVETLREISLPTTTPAQHRHLKVRGERGIGEWFGRAWFVQPKPAEPSRLRKEFFPWLDDEYVSRVVPPEHGERIVPLHDRVARALAHIVQDVDEEYHRSGRGDEEVTLLLCGHAAQIIASGRALTGQVPDDLDEEDFKCFTCGISKFTRRQVPGTGEPYYDDDWRNSGGVAGGWDCILNSDCSHLSQGEERGWHFHGDESFDSYEAPTGMGIGIRPTNGGSSYSKL
ncbi:putative transporter MCH2 [Exophiala dermatitidis]